MWRELIMKKYMNSVCCMILFLMAVVLELTPQAYGLLHSNNRTLEAWITDETGVSATNDRYTVVKVGAPEKNIDDYTAVEVQELKIYVHNVNFTGHDDTVQQIISITEIRTKNMGYDVGILEPNAE